MGRLAASWPDQGFVSACTDLAAVVVDLPLEEPCRALDFLIVIGIDLAAVDSSLSSYQLDLDSFVHLWYSVSADSLWAST